MAHFAKLDSSNKVLRVNVVHNSIATTEEKGVAFLKTLHGSDTNWKQTSYNTHEGKHLLGGTPFRKNYAGSGYTYDSGRDAFIPPKPYDSWTLDETKGVYVAPVTYPTVDKYTDENGDEKEYLTDWDEDNLRWRGVVWGAENIGPSDYYYWDPASLSWTSYIP